MPHWLNDEHAMMREAVKRFAQSEIAPISQRLWEEESFPYTVWTDAAKLGFTGLPYPEQYAGGGGTWLSFVIVLEELARGVYELLVQADDLARSRNNNRAA